MKTVFILILSFSLLLYYLGFIKNSVIPKKIAWWSVAILFCFIASQEIKVDSNNYKNAFEGNANIISDFGYNLICKGFYKVSQSFVFFNFVQAAFTVICIHIAAKRLKINKFIPLFFYVLYFSIIRDFSQSRIALALNIYLIFGFGRNKLQEIFGMLLASFVHKSVLVLFLPLFVFLVGQKYNSKKIIMLKCIFVFCSGILLDQIDKSFLEMLDNRYEIYTNVKNKYSDPGFNIIPVLFNCFFLFLAYISRQKKIFFEQWAFIILCCCCSLSLSLFFTSNLFISNRLSSICLSFIPFLAGYFFNITTTRKYCLWFFLAVLLFQFFSQTSKRVFDHLEIEKFVI